MSTQTLKVQGDGYTISLAPEAITLRDEKLADAAKIIQVTNAAEQESALMTAGVLKGLTKACEKNREEVKAPVLDLGRLIDGSAKQFSKPLEAEISRIEKLVGSFQAEERRKAAAAELEIQREKNRLAELQRRAEEAERQAQFAKNKAAREKAEAEAAKLREQVTDAEISMPEAPVAAPQAANASVQEKFEIVIESVEKLYAAFPEAVELSVKQAVLNDIVYRRKERDIPGVRLTPVVKVAARSISPQLQIQ